MLGYGQMIAEARDAAGLTQKELAEILGLTGHHDVTRLEAETKTIDPELFPKILGALPTLRPPKLIEAMGYPLYLPPREWAVPPELVKRCAPMSQEDLAVLLRVARGLLAAPEDQRGQGR